MVEFILIIFLILLGMVSSFVLGICNTVSDKGGSVFWFFVSCCSAVTVFNLIYVYLVLGG